MKISGVVLLPLLVLPLAACGSNVVPSSGEAHTIACRGYVLTIGDTDKTHVAEMISQASALGDDIANDQILVKVRSAAAVAGSTAGLADGDFARFRTLVENLDALAGEQKVQSDGTTSIPATSLAPVSRSVAAVHKLCY